ncbi:MAG TPA: MFS transporter [Terriglobia bacterium]|nr:MFS transporter [Terriglobia bacterium]
MRRWQIAILISSAIAISYLDRQTLPVAIQAIGKEIPLTNQQFSDLQSAFLFSYALMYAGGGKLADALGTRRGFTLIMAFWSLACASHAWALSFSMLAASRFLLGMGEGGGFPAATRAVAEWFPEKERATAMGIINAGTAVGAVLAPPLIALVLIYASWRWVFIITGTFGLLWTVWWRLAYYPPGEHSGLSSREREEIRSILQVSVSGENGRWLDLLRFRETWGLVTAKFLSDAAWYFYLFWLPKYLYDARGFDIKTVGKLAWIPYAASGVGCLAGGWFSSWLVRRQFSLGVARKLALGLSAVVMPSILLVPRVEVSWALAIFSLAYFGQQSWSTLVMVLPTDLYPRHVVGAVAGLVGFGGAMGGIVFGEVVGYMLDHGSGYGPVFFLAGSFHVLAFLVILIAVPKFRQLDPA